MDKYEYNLKLDQMKSLYAEEKYDEAAEIADTINWNKIKNVNALVKAGEIYEKTQRFEDSRDVLLMAYDRSPIGRMIIYRLATVAIKMQDYQAAQDYYDEFVEIAPHDTLKFVLRYDIQKAKGASYSDLIPILEELKEQEYTEEWAYELAYLYHKAGMSDKCVDACDELILWFGDGPYVERALELKMLYQPLTKVQEEKYRSYRQSRDVSSEKPHLEEQIHDSVEIPKVDINPERYNTVNLQEEIARGMQQIMEATEKETVTDTLDSINKIVEEIPYLQLPKEEETEKRIPYIETDEEIDGSLRLNFQEMLGEDSDGQIRLMTDERRQIEHQITGQITIEEVLDEWERTKRAAEAALEDAKQRKLESAKVRALQQAGDLMERLTDVMPKLDAGVTPKELLEEKYMQDLADAAMASEGLFGAEAYSPEEQTVSESFISGEPSAGDIPYIPAGQEEIPYMPGEPEVSDDLKQTVAGTEPEMTDILSGIQVQPEPEIPVYLPEADTTVVQGMPNNLSGGDASAEPEGSSYLSGKDTVTAPESASYLSGENTLTAPESASYLSGEDTLVDPESASYLSGADNMTDPESLAYLSGDATVTEPESMDYLPGMDIATEPESAAYLSGKDNITDPESSSYLSDEDTSAAPEGLSYLSGEDTVTEPEGTDYLSDKNNMTDPESSSYLSGEDASAEPESAAYLSGKDNLTAPERASYLSGEDTLADKDILAEPELLDDPSDTVTAAEPESSDYLSETEPEAAEYLKEPITGLEPEHLQKPLAEKEVKENSSFEETHAEEFAFVRTRPQDRSTWKEKTIRMPDIPNLEDLDDDTASDDETPVLELTDEQKAVFSYFMPVKGMENQLCKALAGISKRLKDKGNADHGNLIIQGSQGSGRTTLATSIIKVLQQETGYPDGKIGKIQAEVLNEKDLVKLLRKVSGGCLIIEQAGGLSLQAELTLSLLMEQNDSGLLVILQDTSKGIKKLLAQDEGFARKFTEQITVPIFTNDELVTFARSYSRELGYKIDDMAVLALYNRISNIQRLDQATTLTEVKEIVDEAIDREAHGGLKKAFSILTANRYTDDDRIVLREKDFE